MQTETVQGFVAIFQTELRTILHDMSFTKQLMKHPFTTKRVFRFVCDVSGPYSPDFRSPKSLLRPRDYRRLLESGMTVAEELKMVKRMSIQYLANRTASGELRMTSPMIPVLEDPAKALSSTHHQGGDRTLRNIILDSTYLSTFDIPEQFIHKPHTYETESELMVLCNCLWKYLVATVENPYSRAQHSEELDR